MCEMCSKLTSMTVFIINFEQILRINLVVSTANSEQVKASWVWQQGLGKIHVTLTSSLFWQPQIYSC